MREGLELKVLFFGRDSRRVEQLADAMREQWPDLKPLMTPDGVTAPQVCQQEGSDLVMLCDDLPDSGTYEGIEQIRRFSNVPIIVASEGAGEHDIAKALELGADRYIRLPCSTEQVLARVQALLRRMGAA